MLKSPIVWGQEIYSIYFQTQEGFWKVKQTPTLWARHSVFNHSSQRKRSLSPCKGLNVDFGDSLIPTAKYDNSPKLIQQAKI